MRAVDVLKSKREGRELSREEIAFLVNGYTAGAVPDYQVSAFLMAVCLRGITAEETVALTETMLRSGAVLDFSDVAGPKIDKHSTGGVGDKTSLIIAPLAAAAGVIVPMISGRGLGHSGGTLDKLEAIPGFDVRLDEKRFREVVGVELSASLHAIALRNVACVGEAGALRSPVRLVHQDAASYAIPDGPLIVYLYHPFREDIASELVAHVVASCTAAPRPVAIVYGHPTLQPSLHARVFEQGDVFRKATDGMRKTRAFAQRWSICDRTPGASSPSPSSTQSEAAGATCCSTR